MATIPLSIYTHTLKPLVIVPQLANCLSAVYTSQSGSILGPQVQVKLQALKFYKKHLEKKFPSLFTKALTSKIIELPTENPPPMKVDLLIVTISKR